MQTNEIQSTPAFDRWFDGLRDRRGKTAILARIRRLSLGNPGHHRVLRAGVAELKVRVGPGYRVYYRSVGSCIVLLLRGGDKDTQREDIARALTLAQTQEP